MYMYFYMYIHVYIFLQKLIMVNLYITNTPVCIHLKYPLVKKGIKLRQCKNNSISLQTIKSISQYGQTDPKQPTPNLLPHFTWNIKMMNDMMNLKPSFN